MFTLTCNTATKFQIPSLSVIQDAGLLEADPCRPQRDKGRVVKSDSDWRENTYKKHTEKDDKEDRRRGRVGRRKQSGAFCGGTEGPATMGTPEGVSSSPPEIINDF